MKLLFFFFALQYVNGVVAGIHSKPVFWSEVQCRAKFEGVRLSSPDEPQSGVFIKKRVYDRLIVAYHKLGSSSLDSLNPGCEQVTQEARLVLQWLQKQKKIWGKNSAESFKTLVEQLERHYEVSWR